MKKTPFEIAEEISRIEVQTNRIPPETARKIAKLFRGTKESFFVLDETPGKFGYQIDGKEWHWKLRWCRNNSEAFRKAFENLK